MCDCEIKGCQCCTCGCKIEEAHPFCTHECKNCHARFECNGSKVEEKVEQAAE